MKNHLSKRKYLMIIACFTTVLTGTLTYQGCGTHHEKETKTGDQLFGRWMSTQTVCRDYDTESMKEHLTPAFALRCKERYTEIYNLMTPFSPFLNSFFATKVGQGPQGLTVTMDAQLKEKLGKIYFMIEHDMPAFIGYLQSNGFESGKLNDIDVAANFRDIIRRDRGLIELFFPVSDIALENEYLRAVSNRFFEFCFNPQTFPIFEELLKHEDSHPIIRILYSTVWYYLAGNGWKHWNRQCLEDLKKEADAGKKVIYIGGGNDVYQLLRFGINNIEVIDPQLPTQPRYYSEGWDWLLKKDGVGNEVKMKLPDGRELLLQCVSYTESGSFKKKLVTEVVAELPKSIIEWAIFDTATQKRIGSLVMNRRTAVQQDFVENDKQVMLISFNELYFIVTPNAQKSWGINPEEFDGDFRFYVKQLREPVTRDVMLNMRKVEMSKFSFIALGTEVI